MNNKILAYIKLILVVILWGISYHTAKYLVINADVYTISFIRYLLSTIILVSIYIAKKGPRALIHKSVQEWNILILAGFVGVFAYNVFFFKAESFISANHVVILYALTPCLSILLGMVFLNNKIKMIGYLGILTSLIGAIGVICVSSDNVTGNLVHQTSPHAIFLGEVFALLAVLCMAIYNILNKKASGIGIDAFTLVTFSAVFGLVFLSITFIIFAPHLVISQYSIKFWGAMLYTVLIATILCYKWYGDAINQIGVSKTSIFLNGVPLSSVLCGVFLLGEPISSIVLIFGAIIISGVIMVNFAAAES